MNRRLSLILVIIVMKSISYAQCSLVVTPANPTISCIGGSLRLCALVTNSDIDQSQLLSNAGTSARTLSGYSIFQTFKAGVTGTLTQIDIGFFNYINGSGVLKIYQGDGISGTVLFSQNVSVSCPSGSCLIPFDVGSIPIVAGETYTFHFIPGVGIPDPYGVQSMVPGNYSNGYFGLIDPSGTYDTGFDMIFRTHVQSTVTYLWSNGSTDSCIDISSPGIYNVTITTHPFSCSKSMQVNVTGTTTPPNASAGLDKILDCSHPTIVLDGSSTTSGVTYQWSGPGILNGGSTPNPTVNMAGIYTLTVTQTSTGCANTDIVVVTGTTTLPNVSAGLDKILDCSHLAVVLDGSSTTSG
ncbi:MAG: hypothetical protein K1X55_17895, partial [Chitinophagales bacterium]|nr:hypothetical protein [Chitinophagales bacterium]